jgi:hypothetical protein
MKLIIGCPIYKRNWIFPIWAASIERQSISLKDVGFIFVVSSSDEETISMINKWKNFSGKNIGFINIITKDDIVHHEHSSNSRQWTMSKYHNMVALRNTLLSEVRKYQPDFFFSLDSDILVQNPSTIELLISHIKEGADAVSPLMFMTPFGTDFPSVMSWIDKPGEKAKRNPPYPFGTYFQSDIIMAAKMMSKDVYNNVDYEFHAQGEDLGWCANANKKGFNKLFSAAYIYAPHIMHEEMLDKFIQSGDPRISVTFENMIKI